MTTLVLTFLQMTFLIFAAVFFRGVAGDSFLYLLLKSLVFGLYFFFRRVWGKVWNVGFSWLSTICCFQKERGGTAYRKKKNLCNEWSVKHIWVWCWRVNWYRTRFQKGREKKKKKIESYLLELRPNAVSITLRIICIFLLLVLLQQMFKNFSLHWPSQGSDFVSVSLPIFWKH